ncbi:MAG TPA: ABC transporter ATP-binding protein [Ilumatobacter sp.]|nr:ABC transporter ATP-binding protein [Ilumatobacter sp.]
MTLDAPSPGAARRAGAAIELRGVMKRFGGVEVLTPIDLSVHAGEVVTILGPSGCGKTTLLRIVAGLETSSAGLVAIDDAGPHVARRAKRIGFVPQSPALLPWRTVEQNATLLQDLNRRANPTDLPNAVDLLDRVGLSAFRHAYPHELSGGMQQRVALVRAFALGAPYLLMDEPFAALDEITRADMRYLLAALREPLNTTVLFVTHSLAEAVFISDRVLVMSSRPGRVIEVVDVDLPHPRLPELEDTPEFFAIETRLRHALTAGNVR